jgi:hypothetical protein
VEVSTQKLRTKTLRNLEEIFKAATKIARGEIKHQRINGKMVPISLKQKRKWVRVAACVAQTMNKIASNIDEQEINAQFDELERLVKEDSQKGLERRRQNMLLDITKLKAKGWKPKLKPTNNNKNSQTPSNRTKAPPNSLQHIFPCMASSSSRVDKPSFHAKHFNDFFK